MEAFAAVKEIRHLRSHTSEHDTTGPALAGLSGPTVPAPLLTDAATTARAA